MRLARLSLLIASICALLPCRADEVKLKNGSSFEGTVVEETDSSITIDVGAGRLTFPKADVARVLRERQKPPAAEPGPSEAPPAAVPMPAGGLFLRDGRCVAGEARDLAGGFLAVDTPQGRATFPQWLVDRSGTQQEEWGHRRVFTGIDDPALLAELDLRRAAWDRGERKGHEKLPADLQALDAEVTRLAEAQDGPGIEAAAARVEGALGALRGPELALARQLASRAWREAALATRKAAGREPRFHVAELFARAHTHDDPTVSAMNDEDATDVLYKLLDGDPCGWTPYFDLFLTMEHFAVACYPGDWDSDHRWCRDGVDWGSNEGNLPEKIRIVTGEGEVIVTAGAETDRPYALHLVAGGGPFGSVVPRSDRAPDGIASVWVPAVRTLGATGGVVIGQGPEMVMEPGWSRLFWCPVERAWRYPTVPEMIMKVALGPALDDLHRIAHDERHRDLLPSRRALDDWDRGVDSLIHSYDPLLRAIAPHAADRATESVENLNRALQGIFEAHGRSLRRRAAMERGRTHVGRSLAALGEALQGKRVDLAPLVDPGAVVSPRKGPGEKEAILAALGALSITTRVETMRGHAIDRYAQDADVVALLLSKAKDDLDHHQASEASRVLQRWKNPEFDAWLKGRILEESAGGGHTGIEERYLGDVDFWEKAARRTDDPTLRSKGIEKLALVGDAEKDAAAAALARLAPELPTPQLQDQAIESLARLNRPQALAGVILSLRYPQAREEAWEELKRHGDPRAEALAVLLKAQEDVWRRGRRSRHDATPEEDPEVFRGRYWSQLVEGGAIDRARAAGGEAFVEGLRGLLDPRRLQEDRWLEDVFGKKGNDAHERLAMLHEPTELTRAWVARVAAAEPDVLDAEKRTMLLVAFGDATALTRVRSAVAGGEDAELSRGGAIQLLGYSRDLSDAQALLALLDDRSTQGAAVQALQRLTGRKGLKRAEDWKSWDGRAAGK